VIDVGGDHVVRHDAGEKVEPEKRNLRQHPAFVRNARGQNVVKSGDAIGGDEKQALVVNLVNITHLAAGVKLEFGEVSSQQDGI
jgi:hypothetical protein